MGDSLRDLSILPERMVTQNPLEDGVFFIVAVRTTTAEIFPQLIFFPF